jgi:hypothetical protein
MVVDVDKVERLGKLYRLNGQIESVKRKLGVVIGESRVLCSDSEVRELCRVYDMLKVTQDRIYREYFS